jgi:hypothetical protein
MTDNARRTGPALEAMYRFTLWLIPTLEKFPRGKRRKPGAAAFMAGLETELLHPRGRRRLPEANVRRFRNRLRGMRDRWRAGTIEFDVVEQRVQAWIGHAGFADVWRLRHAIFRGGMFDPALENTRPEA